MKYAIQVRELKKSYGSHIVLKGLDFQIEKGEIFALLGVNGAGKTTTLECIEGLKKYDSGTITVNGKMGIQLQSSSLPAHIKPMEAVKLFAKWNNTKIDYAINNSLQLIVCTPTRASVFHIFSVLFGVLAFDIYRKSNRRHAAKADQKVDSRRWEKMTESKGEALGEPQHFHGSVGAGGKSYGLAQLGKHPKKQQIRKIRQHILF